MNTILKLSRLPALAAVLGLAAACDGPQSWLGGGGEDAIVIERMLWLMLAGAAVIWTAVIGLAIYAARIAPQAHDSRWPSQLVIWGGIVAPTAVISVLLVSGLLVLRDMTNREADLTVRVDGEQWWWRVTYETPGGDVVSANEVRLPKDRVVELLLTSDDVIHAFWVPALGGKMDMIPGRENRLTLKPVETGTWRGVCAEYCGGAHAQMAFPVVVMEPGDFEVWLAHQAEPAAAAEGADAFLDAGCGACHTIRGTEANGPVGPDLTHVGGRTALGAGILPMDTDAMVRFIAETEAAKPGVNMPTFGMLPDDEIRRIAGYLLSLE